LATIGVRLLSAYVLVHNGAMAALGIAAPAVWGTGQAGGFEQTLPGREDAPLAVVWQRQPERLLLATALGGAVRLAAETC
jgi:hypothetical protein